MIEDRPMVQSQPRQRDESATRHSDRSATQERPNSRSLAGCAALREERKLESALLFDWFEIESILKTRCFKRPTTQLDLMGNGQTGSEFWKSKCANYRQNAKKITGKMARRWLM